LTTDEGLDAGAINARRPSDATVSVVIGSYNRRFYLRCTIESIRRELQTTPHEIIVVDGGSSDGSVRWLVEQKDVITIVQHNRGSWNGRPIERRSWGYFMNLGFRAASAPYVCMLSDDCLVVPGAITNGIARLQLARASNESVGAVAFYWRNWPDRKRYWVGKTFGDRLFVNHGLYTKAALEAVGYIDETTFHFYHADGDLCLRMWEKGFTCVDGPDSYIEHRTHANRRVRASNDEKQQHDWNAYQRRWQNLGVPAQDWIEKDFDDPARTARRYWRRGLRRLLPG